MAVLGLLTSRISVKIGRGSSVCMCVCVTSETDGLGWAKEVTLNWVVRNRFETWNILSKIMMRRGEAHFYLTIAKVKEEDEGVESRCRALNAADSWHSC